MWHYEYTIVDGQHRVDAESFAACLEGILKAREQSPHQTAVKIFEGGNIEFGSGLKQYDSLNPVGLE